MIWVLWVMMVSLLRKSASLPLLLLLYFFFLADLLLLLPPRLCRAQSTPATSPVAPQDLCNGVFVSYQYNEGARIRPFLSDAASQPYSFKSTATILNTADVPLKSWNLFVGFRHREVLVSSDPAVLTDGSPLPARVGDNGTFFSGFPNADLNTAIETAGDINQMQVQIELVGTQFGIAPPAVPLPGAFYLANDGYNCPDPTRQGTNLMYTCCTIDPNFKATVRGDDMFLPRKDGDLTIAYDVIQSHESSYLAMVTMSNHNPLGRLDNWKLSWEWMRGEFIFGMKGAYTTVTDASDCIFGEQGGYYKDFDFTQVMNCQRTPTIVDLPLSMANDTNVGLIPSCCRNGTLLPPYMDPTKSVSAFQLQVYKMPPDVNRTQLFAPQSWKISGNLNPDYQCDPPVRVSPAQFPNPGALQSTTAAIASWQVVCNITQAANSKPRCCVSFSAFYNDSVIPCQTCACGCPSNVSNTCSSRAPALLLPSESLLVPFHNRTQKAVAWADIKHFNVPRPLPCGDFCGVSINWHVFTDYSKGWSARITLFNWVDSSFADWFTAVEMDKAFPGFEAVYSFNGSSIEGVNNTIFMQGRPGLNFLVAEVDGADPEGDPRVPGKQQSVISFTKKPTPGIDVVGGDGFPSKVFFNGEECSLPLTLPTGQGGRTAAVKTSLSLILVLACLFFLLMEQP